MPALAPVVLNDGTSNQTYNPVSGNGSEALLASSSNGSRQLSSTLKIITRDQGNGARRSIARIAIPVVRAINGTDTQVDDIIVEVNLRAPVISTTEERKKAREQAEALVASAFFTAVFDNGEGFW